MSAGNRIGRVAGWSLVGALALAVGARLLERYAPDEIRFYAALMAPQNHDTDYDPAEFRQLSEEVLSNQYGNLVQRLLVLARAGVTDLMNGFVVTLGSRNGCGGTNGSSSAAMMSDGTRIRSTTRMALARW